MFTHVLVTSHASAKSSWINSTIILSQWLDRTFGKTNVPFPFFSRKSSLDFEVVRCYHQNLVLQTICLPLPGICDYQYDEAGTGRSNQQSNELISSHRSSDLRKNLCLVTPEHTTALHLVG